jgi:N-acetylneuraminic acid mutarotase
MRLIQYRPGHVALIGLILMLIALAPTVVQGDDNPSAWRTRAPMLLPRSETSVARLGDQIYVMGGYPGERVTSDQVQVYDSVTDSWSLGPSLPLPMHHTMAAVADRRLYLFGGEGGNPVGTSTVFLNLVHELNVESGVWEPRADMPSRRSGGGTAVIDGKIYVAGGRPPRGADFAMYDPEADTWTELPQIPTARNHLGVAAIGGKVYVAGGRFGGGVGSEMTDILEIYDSATGSWTRGAPLLKPRAGVSSIVAHGCLYLIGGEGNDADPRGIFEENEMYDPRSDSWTRLEPMPLPTHGLIGGAFIDPFIYIAGGARARGVSGDVPRDLQVFRAEARCE